MHCVEAWGIQRAPAKEGNQVDQAAALRAPGRGVMTVAAIAFACSGVTALFNFYVYIILPSRPGHFSYDIFGVIYLLVALDAASVLLSVGAGVLALGMALRKRERLAAISFGILLAAAAFAAYALSQQGDPGHPVVSLVYGFPLTDGFDLRHPVAQYGSAALIPAIAPVALAYALTRGKARQISAAAGPLAVLGLWVAIRIAG